MTGGPAPEAGAWQRLDQRVILITALFGGGLTLGSFLPVAVVLVAKKPDAVPFLPIWFLLPLLGGAAVGYLKWRRTRYRVGPERAELHTGLLTLTRRSLARERIRSVDLTAHPLLRILGLVKVRIGTGEQSGGDSTLEFDAVSRTEGERLRRLLLDRPGAAGADPVHDGPLAVLDPGWIRYAPVSFVAPALGGAAAGAVMQVSEWFGAQAAVIDWVGDRFENTSIVTMILVLAAAALVVGTAGALGLWVEMWWNYRLEREPGGTLRVRRGLLTTRSLSVEERRLRGVELIEPLGVRTFGAARVDAVATGIAEDDENEHADHKTLLPPAPRAVADEVAAHVLRERVAPTSAPLTAHPRAARQRRIRWALGSAAVPVVVLAGLGALLDVGVLGYVAGACALVLTPLALLAARDAYRNLGHGITGEYLVARSGVLRRSTVALQRGGVVGWTVKQSWFQRRAGVLTLTATTAAGSGAYSVYDADASEGLTFAAESVPDLIAPFLERPRS